MYMYQANLKARTAEMLAKVPEITLYFWITKLLTTALGEVASDYLFERLNPIFSLPISVAVFIAAMLLQFKAQKYIASLYWLVVIMVSIFGTTAADVIRVGLGIPYMASTFFFVIMLAAVLLTWYVKEKSLSIHSINTRRREVFYWLTVLTTFALGTSAGDLTASSLHLGYLASGIMFFALMLIPAVCYWLFNMKEVMAFWFAYILTRPVGASFADWFSAAHANGGVGYSKGAVSLVLFIAIVILVVFRGGAAAKMQESPQAAANH